MQRETPPPGGVLQFSALQTIYIKIVYGFNHELSLTCDSDAEAIIRAAAVNNVDVAKSIWLRSLGSFLATVLEEELRLYKTIRSKSKIDCGFRRRQCDSIGVLQNLQFYWRLSANISREKPKYIIALHTGTDNN